MLGGAYTVVTLLMGGISHASGHVGHIGDTLHIPHVGDMLGHHHVGHIGPAHGGHSGHTTHADSGHHTGHGNSDAQIAARQHVELHVHGEGDGFNIFQYLNPMSVAGFLLGFGGSGVASRMLGAHPTTATLCGLAGGGGLWLLAYLVITRVFGASEGTSHNKREELIGTRAQVTALIAGSQPGMVAYVVSGSRQSLRAVSDDDDPIPVGAAVRIRRIESNTARVTRVD
jgi:membrane protein implicated in regulation of membrane protease activity